MDLGATNSGQPKHSAADLRRTAPTWPDDHLMGPIWEIPPDRPSAEAAFAEAAAGSPAGAASYQFMDEDELASWLNCEIGEAGGGSVQGWMAEGFDAAPSAADSKGPTIKSGSKRKEAEVSMLGAMMRPSSPASAERKRMKACEAEAVQEHGCRHALQRKDPEVEYGERRKQARECGSVRKLRAMEIHKLSERKRRDKINAKMKALQELIPSCRKPDKASTLDEAIQYMKSLQLQVQMMSVRCNASPLLFPGMRPFFSPIGLGMQMGLGMDLGMTTGMEFAHGCPMLPFGQLPHPAIGGYRPVHFGPRTLPLLFPPAVPAANQIGDEAINLLNHLLDPRRSSDVVQIPPFSEPHRWFLGTACSQVQPQSEVFEESPINTSNASDGSHNRLEG